MITDYLWDKSGRDAETERLESLLGTMRYQPEAQLRLPAAISPGSSRSPWWRISLAFAISACFVIAGFVFTTDWSVRIESENAGATGVDAVIREEPGVLSTTERPLLGLQTAVPEKVFFHTSRREKTAAGKTVARAGKLRNGSITGEERFAYSQLMLALSITGSKLKVVTDTVNGGSE